MERLDCTLYFSNPLINNLQGFWGLSSISIKLPCGDETGTQWLNGATISFVNLIHLLFL